LPEPFNRPKVDVSSNMSKIPTSSFPLKTSTGALTAQQSGVSETCIQGDEIPEGIEKDLNSYINEAPSLSLPRATSTEAPNNQQPAGASHLPPSFRKCFSHKVRSNEAESGFQGLPSDLHIFQFKSHSLTRVPQKRKLVLLLLLSQQICHLNQTTMESM
jgi:hypothetical protein